MGLKLPKAGTKIEDLRCPKCKKVLSEITTEQPIGKIHCEESDCPQKPKEQGNG